MTLSRILPTVVFLALAFLLLLLAPWWVLMVVAFAYGCSRARVSPGFAFWPGLLVGALIYLLGALWYGGGGELPGMLGRVFSLGSAGGLYALTALVGGLSAGAFAMLGAYARAALRPAGVPEPRAY